MIKLTLFSQFTDKADSLWLAPEQVESIRPVRMKRMPVVGKPRPLNHGTEVATKTGQSFTVTEDADAVAQVIQCSLEGKS